MIGDSQGSVDRDGNIHIKEVEFPATKGLWDLLTRRKVDKKLVTSDDLKQYKTILETTNAHLEGYEPDANIRTSKGLKFMDVFRSPFQARVKAASKPHCSANGYRIRSPCCGDCISNPLHSQHFPAYISFNRHLDTSLPVNR